MDYQTKQQLISSIYVDEANFDHIKGTRRINGTLGLEIRRILTSYATQESVGFAEWMGEFYVKMHGGWMQRYADQRDLNNLKTTEQLYSKFLAERDMPIHNS
jgi:hypothetical protein